MNKNNLAHPGETFEEKDTDHLIENKSQSSKRKYKKPTIKSEALNSYGAVCNGTRNGGRKASAMAPSFCNANCLNS